MIFRSQELYTYSIYMYSIHSIVYNIKDKQIRIFSGFYL